jgi:hypothetical protein
MLPENNLENRESGHAKRPKNASFADTVTYLKTQGQTITRPHHDLIHDILTLKPVTPAEYIEQQKALMQAIGLLS